MLSLHLMPIFNARGIERPFSFMVKSGFTPHAAHILLNGGPRSFRLDHIEHLCRILICEPNDLVVYTPEKAHPLLPDHPLNNLKATESIKAVNETLATVPLKQLKEITKQINAGLNPPE